MKYRLLSAALVPAALAGALSGLTGAAAAPAKRPVKPAAKRSAKPSATKPTAPPEPKIETAPRVALPSPVWSLAYSPDGKLLAAGAYQRIELRSATDGTVLQRLEGHAGPVRSLAWTADGKQIAGGGGRPGEQGEVRIWTLGTGGAPEGSPVVLNEHKDVVESVAFSTAGDALLSAGVDEKAVALNLSTRKVIRPLTDHTNRVVAVAASQNGKYVATGSLDRTVKIWSAADYGPMANVEASVGPVLAIAFLPPGDQVAIAGEEGNIRIYRVSESRSGKQVGINLNLVRQLNGNRTPVHALAVGVTNKTPYLAYGGTDKTVNVIDLSNGNRKYTLKECPDVVYSLAFSPDGATLAAGCRDGKVRTWSMADGKLAGEW